MTRAAARRWGIAVLAAFGLTAYGVHWGWRALNSPLSIPGNAQVWLNVPGGAPLTRVASDLADREILRFPRLFVHYARIRGDATRIRAGEYRLHSGTSAVALLDILVAGQVFLHHITVVEGSRANDFYVTLQAHPAISSTTSSLNEVMAELGVPGIHPEGQFFPDTYRFARGTSDIEVLRLAHSAMQRELEQAWSLRTADLPLADSYEALVLASIVEKEARLASERSMIAGVLTRRLRQNMRLQTDPTVIYGLGSGFDGDLRRRDLAADSPYNTYTRNGLPPTPISLPGRAALRAAVQPADGDALYFVATGESDGSHEFSATLEEHNAAVARYLQRLQGIQN
jgi:UPF0755 protein